MEDSCINVFNSRLMGCCVEPGEYVAREGEPGDGVYFIWDGQVCIYFHVIDLRETKKQTGWFHWIACGFVEKIFDMSNDPALIYRQI